ncbi:MAG TPA: radical SAM family heme chaperone HemW [Frankiaceae bacterium]|jgi:oxygen-independent coproporphyrinogen-3 oxidase|nr:radical SAM family heme chaperone HemW [Frankiaceae bacterium]
MPSAPPPGDPAPADGALPERALETLGRNGFGVYVHVPYCAHRCGYCDFNTYVDDSGAAASYADAAVAEVRLAARVLRDPPPADTVFLGGGTPTLLPPEDLARILAAIRDELGLRPGAEVTTEANPETVTPASLAALREAGFDRISLGMQSAVPHVLATLERRHTPGRAAQAAAEARAAGFDRVSLDLIYGTPGETDDDWRASLDAVLDADPGHVSAYSLTVEPGTRLHAQGAAVDPDVQADRYELADDLLTRAGYGWYEISNWARTDADRCRHNELYWRDGDWWGVGPGAHSHVGGVRWWNVRLPREHAAAVAAGRSPAQAREVLDDESRRVERVLLGVRLAGGHPATDLDDTGREAAAGLADDGLLDAAALAGGTLVLTRRGRLLADGVVLRLVG